MLEMNDVWVQSGKKVLLSGLQTAFRCGELAVVLGPNGAGKSTLLKTLAGEYKPQTGGIRLNGKALADYTPGALAMQRAYLAQEHPVAFNFTAQQVVALGRYPHKRQTHSQYNSIIRKAMQQTGVWALQHRVYNSLSGGEKTRVQLARVFAQVWPDETATQGDANAGCWLLLDEPTAALDVQYQHSTLQLVRHWMAASHGQAGAVIVLHDINLALRYADRVVVMAQGQCVQQGAVDEVLTPTLVQEIWGTPCEEVQSRNGHRQMLFACSSEEQDFATSLA